MEPERLGESDAFGYELLRLLSFAGWTVGIQRAFAGGVLVIASRNGLEVRRAGESVAKIAGDVFRESTRVQPLL